MTEYILYWYDDGGYSKNGVTKAESLEDACKSLGVSVSNVVYYETIENGVFTGHPID